jgi:hypothetical protein
MAGRPAKAAALTRAGRRVRARVPAVARLQGRPFERPFAAMAPSLAIERRATRP